MTVPRSAWNAAVAGAARVRRSGPDARAALLRAVTARPRPIRLVVVAAIAALVAGLGAAAGPALASGDPCNPVVNPIVCENSRTGSPDSEWDIDGAGDPDVQGFATDISVNAGQRVNFKIKADGATYGIKVYRLGYYGGAGARFITDVAPAVPLPQTQPTSCITQEDVELYDCGNWAVSAYWNVPSTAVSGVYIAKLNVNGGGSSQITFVVRNDSSTSAVLFKTSDATWQAYNTYGGADFYEGGNNGRAYKLSYNRPVNTRGNVGGRDFLFSNEYPMLRFLERNGYDVSYTTDIDADRRGSLIKNHQVFLSVGHDEYWSGNERANVEAARDAGVNLAFFSGNEVYWRTRYENSKDGSNTAYRTLTCYKETWANARIEDTPAEWTGTWRDPRFMTATNGAGRPENGLTGTLYMANSVDLAIQVPSDQGAYRLWRYTDVASQAGAGETATLAPHTIGYESDEDLDNGSRPAGLIDLSSTTGPTPQYLRDFGNLVTPGTTNHHLTLYRASSGALVFSAGTIQWAWGLDSYHDGEVQPADKSMQQATVNLLADMGVQPATLMAELHPTSASADTTAPTVTVTSPSAAVSTVANGAKVTLRGTATDADGKVAGVEVSTDNGASWHPAQGTTDWSYVMYTQGIGSQVVQVRAIDDSANIGQAPVTRQFTLTGPNTIFGARTPGSDTADDSSSVELGTRFTPTVDGFVTGVRFYKGPGNDGVHTGTLWTSGGTALASGTFSGESDSGWQTLQFDEPVNVHAGTTYVASYHAPDGHYANDGRFFSALDDNAGPLIAPRTTGDNVNGVYGYGTGFPSQSYNDTNYYVDVTFVPSSNAPPTVLATTPLAGANGVAVSSTLTAVFSKAVTSSSIHFAVKDAQGTAVAGTTTYSSATKTATFTPAAKLAAATSFTASVSATDTDGRSTDQPKVWTFETEVDPSVQTLFVSDAQPVHASAIGDATPLELGVRFTPSTAGTIVGVRFYQGPGNTGTHTGSLWTSSGAQLATVTFPDGSGSGWQTALFATPVPVTAGTTYVASYFAPNGYYAYDTNFFNTTWTNGSLSAPGGGNGVFRANSSGFPESSYQNTNYWVDPLFRPASGGTGPSPSPSVTTTPTTTPTSSPTSSPTTSPSPSASPTPTGPVAPPAGVTVFAAGATPAVDAWNDSDELEVGAKVKADTNGTITGLRFYKGAGNSGVHTGTLWTADGQELATGEFVGETAGGWQTLKFGTPVPVTAGTTYVASYHTTKGHYSLTANAFVFDGVDNPPVHILPNGAVYRYGTRAFPNGTSNHNYWVDVYFTANGS